MAKTRAYFLPQEYARPALLHDYEKPVRENPALIARLKAYDPHLVIYYDKAAARYAIARITETGVYLIDLWQDPKTKSFLPLDNRLFEAIKSWDLRPHLVNAPRSADEAANRQEAEEEAVQQKAWDDFDDDISHATRENKRQLMRAIESAR